MIPGVINSILQGGGADRSPQAQVDHPGAVVGRISDAVGDHIQAAAAIRPQRFDRHDAAKRANSHHAGWAFSLRGGCDAGYMGTVEMIPHWITVVVVEIPPVQIVDVTVEIVVHTWLTIFFSRIVPHVRPQLAVVVVDARVHDGDGNLCRI